MLIVLIVNLFIYRKIMGINKTITLGDTVLCDMCNKDYTDSDEKGGIQFQSKAVCPTCTPQIEESAQKYYETEFIKNRCPKGKSFAQWVREDLRNGEPGTITITSI